MEHRMQRRNPALAFALAIGLAVTATSLTAWAETSSEDAKDYRQAVMSALGAHISAISMHVRGLVDDNGFLDEHAQSLARTAAEIGHVFPAGSAVGDSEALPAIWERPEEFAERVAEAERATAALAEAASTGDRQAVGAALREVGAACRGCHDDFRKDDD
jgi:cytochrome c556